MSYFETRLQEDPKRNVLWRTLVKTSFQPMINGESRVLELGAGRCEFINHVRCKRRVAVDSWQGFPQFAAVGVETVVASVTDLSALDDGQFDLIFASNLVEHLHLADFQAMLRECRRVLADRGKLILLQPNYRLCAKRYFDDYTHVSVWTDVSIRDFLGASGWEVDYVKARFLPLTVKSRLPVSPTLIRAYLRSPIKPLAGQMLVQASVGTERLDPRL